MKYRLFVRTGKPAMKVDPFIGKTILVKGDRDMAAAILDSPDFKPGMEAQPVPAQGEKETLDARPAIAANEAIGWPSLALSMTPQIIPEPVLPGLAPGTAPRMAPMRKSISRAASIRLAGVLARDNTLTAFWKESARYPASDVDMPLDRLKMDPCCRCILKEEQARHVMRVITLDIGGQWNGYRSIS